jgi:hypothetical protein
MVIDVRFGTVRTARDGRRRNGQPPTLFCLLSTIHGKFKRRGASSGFSTKLHGENSLCWTTMTVLVLPHVPRLLTRTNPSINRATRHPQAATQRETFPAFTAPNSRHFQTSFEYQHVALESPRLRIAHSSYIRLQQPTRFCHSIRKVRPCNLEIQP